MILLTGFGPFGDVTDNPSERLVRAVHGLAAGGHRIASLVLPVRWGEASRLAIGAARSSAPALVLGFGVAARRDHVAVEVLARREREGADVDGAVPPGPFDGSESHAATLDGARLAACLGARVSSDAGRYLCNAWLYEVPQAVKAPAAFVHLPPDGMLPERLLQGLDAFVLGRDDLTGS